MRQKLSKEQLPVHSFKGVEITPLQFIGTQRSPYTHRKNRESKKIALEVKKIDERKEARSARAKIDESKALP